MSLRTNSARLNLEKLEDRMLPARTVFILDFSPDYRRAGSLYETFFNVRLTNGNVPSFFDFNRDGRVNSTDVTLAAREITARVRGYYKNYLRLGLTIDGGDVLQNSFWGHKWMQYGTKRADTQVNVVYFGGRSVGGEHGLAPLAPAGADIEGSCEVYTRTIAIDLFRSNPYATPQDFARNVASSAAHELGHMQGLHHAVSGASNNIMRPGRSRVNNSFEDRYVKTSGGYAQNAHRELWYSFQGQKTSYAYVSRAVYDIPPAAEKAAGHGCCCSGCSGQADHAEGQGHEIDAGAVVRNAAVVGSAARATPRGTTFDHSLFQAEPMLNVPFTAEAAHAAIRESLLAGGPATRKGPAVVASADPLFRLEEAFLASAF